MLHPRFSQIVIGWALLLGAWGATAQTTAPSTNSLPSSIFPMVSPSTGLTAAQPTTGAPAVPTAVSPTAPAQSLAIPVAAQPLSQPPLPLPPDPSTSLKPVVFGSQIFSGRFSSLSYTGFNPDYQIAVGDRVLLRMWGAVVYEAFQNVDPQGNVFIPNVGPIQVLGVRNVDLNKHVESQVKRTFRANVGVYATLDAAQPVKVYVTGYVRAPGLYGGLSSDSVLNYLDKASGIDPDRGSYLKVQVMRAGKVRATIDLYQFLLNGKLESVQFLDGDTIVVSPRQYAVTVLGEAQNPYVFEVRQATVPATEVLALSAPKPSATHLSVVRNTGVELKSDYYKLIDAAKVTVNSGDVVTVTADKYPTTILVRINGAQLGERSIVLAHGANLKDLLARLTPSSSADMSSLQLFRLSIQARQKQTLEIALRNLETSALTARSSTSEEAALRKTESDMMMAFIDRARQVQPLGQVVLSDREQANQMLLEDGDVVNVPERKNLVLISGEVLFPNAQVFSPKASIEDYISLAGG